MLRLWTAFVVLCLVIASTAEAKSRIFNEKFEELPPVPSILKPTQPPLVGPAEVVPSTAYSAPVSFSGEHRPIDYRYQHPRHGKYSKCDTVPITLLLNDPCKGCLVEVPVCVPCCCLDCPPNICWGTGAFKRDVVTYSWACGYDVRVAFRNRSDALIVTYSELQRR